VGLGGALCTYNFSVFAENLSIFAGNVSVYARRC
jgi:hypothetical protein